MVTCSYAIWLDSFIHHFLTELCPFFKYLAMTIPVFLIGGTTFPLGV